MLQNSKDENVEETRVITSDYAEANSVVKNAYTPDLFGGFSTDLFWKDFDFNAVRLIVIGIK